MSAYLEGGTRSKCTSIAVGQYGQKAPQILAIRDFVSGNKPDPNQMPDETIE
jgi:hypothetical protein